MNTWNHSFDQSSWDRYFHNQHRAIEAWVLVLMNEAIRTLQPEPVVIPTIFGHKVLHELRNAYFKTVVEKLNVADHPAG